MTDDPREILKAAGAECAEVEEYLDDGKRNFMIHGAFGIRYIRESKADKTVIALARIVAKYKWQREIQVVGALDYNGAIARLDELWESHLREQHNA